MLIFKKVKIVSIVLFSVVLFFFIVFLIIPSNKIVLKGIKNIKLDKGLLTKSNSSNCDVLVLTIDDSSLNYLEEKGILYPWPRLIYSKIIEYLLAKGAKIVILNDNLFHNDYDRKTRGIMGVESDKALSETIKSNKVIVPVTVSNQNNVYEVRYPKDLFIMNNNFGFNSIFTENNGIVRKYKLGIDTVDGYLPSIAFKTYQMLNNKNNYNVAGAKIMST